MNIEIIGLPASGKSFLNRLNKKLNNNKNSIKIFFKKIKKYNN